MRDRPILFSSAMVRAILSGSKTQTRRVLTVPWRGSTRTVPYEPYWVDTDGLLFFCDEYGDYHDVEKTRTSPYGVPGDRLWVRETFYCDHYDYHPQAPSSECLKLMEYRADHDCASWEAGCPCNDENGRSSWKPSIFMPRWASRLTLEVTEVRVQRVQDISEEDARAEGLAKLSKDGGITWKYGIPDRDGLPGTDNDGMAWADWSTSAVTAYSRLWDRINEKRGHGWKVNPWCWCVSFKRVLP